MAQHARSGPSHPPRDPRHTPRLAALLGLAAATAVLAALLALRTLDLLTALPSPRFETYLEVPLVGAGALLATWVSVTATLAAACVLARSAGRRWSAGERLVLRHAPAVVRRLASAGVAVSIGAGLVLGAGSAQAAEAEPPTGSAPASPAVVDLGWQSTAQEPTDQADAPPPRSGPSAAPLDPAALESPGAPPTVEDAGPPSLPPVRQEASPSAPAARVDQPGEHTTPTEAGRDIPTAPTELETGARIAATEQDDHIAAASAHAAGSSATRPAPRANPTSGYVPLDGLLGAEQRTLPPQSAAARTGSGAPDATPRSGAHDAAAAPEATESAASTVSVVVLRGDSLWSLAARSLGESATDAQIAVEWQRWYAANAQVIGQDPDLIRPGQVLVAPRTL